MTSPIFPSSTAKYEDWINLAFGHLTNALDTAIDELQRDRDFLFEDEVSTSPEGTDRVICKEEAIRRFVQHVKEEQQG